MARSRSAASIRVESVTSIIVNSAVAVGQRHRGEFEMAAVGHRHAAACPSWRPLVVAADQLADLRRGGRIDQPPRHRRDQFVDPRMLAEPALVEVPHLAEAAVPQIEPAVARRTR